MTMTSAITIPDASAIAVDTSCIDTSEVQSQQDKLFLMEKGEKILRIVARAALEVGQEICDVQEHFRSDDNPQGSGLQRWYKSIGLSPNKAQQWANKFRAFKAYIEIFGTEGALESFNELGDHAAHKIWQLPPAYREAFLADIAVGEAPTDAEVIEVSQRPEVQLTKAEELLAQAKARKESADERWEAVKADPNIPYKIDGKQNPEYQYASKRQQRASVTLRAAEERIAKLQAEIEAEKLKAKQQAEETARVAATLQKLKTDDATARAERVKRLTGSLTVSVPQTLADLQKFFAEKDHYPEEIREHVLEQATYLANYIGDQL